MQPTINNTFKPKEFDMDVVNEYLYRKTKKKREDKKEATLVQNSLESNSTNQLNA